MKRVKTRLTSPALFDTVKGRRVSPKGRTQALSLVLFVILMKTLAFVLLVVGGLVHTFPGLYTWLSGLTAGTPVIQIIVGIVSVILGLYYLFMPAGK